MGYLRFVGDHSYMVDWPIQSCTVYSSTILQADYTGRVCRPEKQIIATAELTQKCRMVNLGHRLLERETL